MDLVDLLHGVKLVDAWVDTDLVKDGYASDFGSGVKGADGVGDVACGHNLGVALDRGLDASWVMSVWNE